MNSKILFLGAVMMLPTFASCQQEKPFPDDAVIKCMNTFRSGRLVIWTFIRLAREEGMQPILFSRTGLPCCWMQEIWEYTPVPRRL